MDLRIIYQSIDNKVLIGLPVDKSLSIEELVKKLVPDGNSFSIKNRADLPNYWSQLAWSLVNDEIVIDIQKAKEVVHEKRRRARAAEFSPYDDIIAKQIPGQDAQTAEQQRQAIRDKYATIQSNIDAATTVDELTVIYNQLA